MMKYNCKRFLSVLLAVCMMFSSIGTQMVYAVGIDGCTCGTDNEIHASDCALMVENQEVCTCAPVDGVHQEGCTFYVPPTTVSEPAPISDEVCTCTPVEGVHQEGCTLYVAPTCSCTPVDGVHQEGCAFYVAPTCSCTPADGVHQEGCALYVAPACTCTPVDGVHQEGCALYVAPACTCTPVDGVHQEECSLYVAPACTCTPVDGVHQDGCALYVAPACSCTPVDGVHQEGCALYVIPIDETGDEISFTAGIYSDANRTQLISDLTSEGATLTGWTFTNSSKSVENRYLGVDLSGLSMDSSKQYQLVVEMAPILYINQNSEPTLANTTVSYIQNEPLTVNTDGTYELAEYSLSNLTYLIDVGTESLTVGLPLSFDMKLWDKQNGSFLGNGTDPLLRVYLQEKQTDGSFQTIQGKNLQLINATVSGSLPYDHQQLYKYIAGTGTSTTVDRMGPDDVMQVVQYHFYSNDYSGGHYAETVEVKIKMPTCTIDGTTYTVYYSDFKFRTSGGSSLFTQAYDTDTGVLTVTAEKFYFPKCPLFEISLSIPDEAKKIEGEYSFSGTISVVENGDIVMQNKKLSFTLDNRTAAEIVKYSAGGKADTKYPDAIHFLGTQGLINKSANIDSGPLLIEQTFDSNNTGAVGVTTVNILADSTAQTIDVTYTLIDGNGNPVTIEGKTEFTATVQNKSSNLTAKDKHNLNVKFQLPAEHQEYYLKTIKYVLNNLPANTKAYNNSGSQGTSAAGTIWGYILCNEIPTVMPEHTMKVSQYLPEDGTAGKVIIESTVVKTTIDAGTKVAYGLVDPAVSSSVVTAGDSVTISGQVQVSSYPYVSNSCMENIRLGLILPEGITVNQSGITAAYKDNSSLAVAEVTTQDLGDGTALHIIAFEQGKAIGYYTEALGALPNGNYLNFSIQLNSEKTVSTQTIMLKDSLFVAGLGLENGSSGAWKYYLATDQYDLNKNEKTDDNIGCFKSTVETSVTFNASPAELAITDELVNADGESGSSLTLTSFADILNYKLHIECTEGGSASEFYYMIPIAKSSMTNDPTFVEKCQVDLKLTGQAVVTTDQGTAMKVLYSTTSITGYSETLSLNDWSETLPEGKTWSDVTAIKVIAAADEIENGSINAISVPLGYAGEDLQYKHMAGYQIHWSSRGYYHYKLGYNSNSGTKSTAGCTVTLTYTSHDPIRFTLTAAKDGVPAGEGAVSTYSFELPEFILAQQYSVKQISPSNVTLVDADYNFDKATSAEANENFRIKISVKKSDADTGSNPIALLKENDIIGSLDANSAPEFTFAIENANALSDIVTDRKVTLTLIGSNGVIVPVEITIKCELAAAEATQSAIVAGKLYSPFPDTSTGITVSCDSAFTAQFVTEYIPANYTGHAIVFNSTPVSGTEITMVDWTNPAALKFYHYTTNGQATVPLTAFSGMGGGASFVESTNTEPVTERLLFVVSFPDGGEALRENMLMLTKKLITDTTSEESSVLTFTTVSKRGFSLTTSDSDVKCGDNFTISYISGCSVVDSRYTGRNLSLVVKPSQETFPIDSCLTVDGTDYHLNAQGYFIIPLKAVHNGDGTATVSFETKTSETTSLQISLWASATANGAEPMMGNIVAGPISVSVKANVAPSFEVDSMSDRLLEKEDLSNTLIVNFSQRNAQTVTIELQRKIGSDYVTQTTILESVNGNTTAQQGVFAVSGNTASIKLSSSTSSGTYRLLFTVSNGTNTIEVPYNFVVVD